MRTGLLYGVLIVLLSGCVNLGPVQALPKTYDLGVSPQEIKSLSNTGLFLNQIQANETIDSIAMLYRLSYDDPNRIAAYTESQWRISPIDLITTKIVQISSIPVRARSTRAMVGRCSVDLSLLSFEQRFSSPTEGVAIVDWKVSVTDVVKRRLIDEARFSYRVPMQRPEASAGVAALVVGVDKAVVDTVTWLSDQVLAKNPACRRAETED